MAPSKSDIAILNFLLGLEYLERDFYAAGIAAAAGIGDQRAFVTTAHRHETAHVAAVRELLGARAVTEPQFNFADATSSPATFLSAAIQLEDLGVRAYKGQLALIEGPTVLKAVVAIHSVEAEHAAWARFLSDEIPTYSGAFEQPLSMTQVNRRVSQSGYVVTPT